MHRRFTGHFTRRLGGTQGKGQPTAFIATDPLRLANGRVTDNRHVENNPTLLQEMDVAEVKP